MEKNALLLTVLTEVLGKVRKSNKHRGQYSYDCPVCSMEKGLRDGDGKGKFEVNLKRNVYKCWVCHETHYTHGSIKKLLWKFGGNSVKSKIKKLGLKQRKQNKSCAKNRIIHSNFWNIDSCRSRDICN